MRPIVRRILTSPPAGLAMVILLLGGILTLFAGAHVDRRTGLEVNNFLNSNTLVQTATDASFFAVMAVGATFVIISGGIDLSVGSVYALAGVAMALALRALGPMSSGGTVGAGRGGPGGGGRLAASAGGEDGGQDGGGGESTDASTAHRVPPAGAASRRRAATRALPWSSTTAMMIAQPITIHS